LLITKVQKHLGTDLLCGSNAFCEPTAPRPGDTENMPLMVKRHHIPDEAHSSRPEMELQLERVSSKLQDRELNALDHLSRARTDDMLASGHHEYLDLVRRGEFRQVCVVCRACREMRSHHCRECGRCVSRLDHHCPWIDNCVGIGNQRMYFIFIVVLLLTMLYFYNIAFHYLVKVFFLARPGSSWAALVEFLWQASVREKLPPVIVILVAAFNLLWVAFVSALVLRHAAYVITNMTTYEVLVRPPHVVRRFPQCRGRMWFFGDFGPLKGIINCLNYWTLHTEQDMVDFDRPECENEPLTCEPEPDSNQIYSEKPSAHSWRRQHEDNLRRMHR